VVDRLLPWTSAGWAARSPRGFDRQAPGRKALAAGRLPVATRGHKVPHLMSPLDPTCWTVVRGAARGDPRDRDDFARRYEPVIRSYLAARWRSSDRIRALDDAIQEVFVECFRGGGALDRLEPDRPCGFRAFLYGVVRVVALRAESARARGKEQAPPDGYDPGQVVADDTSLSLAFDRAWARALMTEAAGRHAEDAEKAGEAARGRVELLRLRFHDGLPVREIARLRGCDPDAVHRDYARARQEFRAALAAVVAFHHPGAPAEVERECAGLLDLLK
jgi:RNA polymerase sigma factor (sigma-70 family)